MQELQSEAFKQKYQLSYLSQAIPGVLRRVLDLRQFKGPGRGCLLLASLAAAQKPNFLVMTACFCDHLGIIRRCLTAGLLQEADCQKQLMATQLAKAEKAPWCMSG